MYRRFDELPIRYLLNLEAHVAALEAIQKELDVEDFRQYKTNTDITTVAASWEEKIVVPTRQPP